MSSTSCEFIRLRPIVGETRCEQVPGTHWPYRFQTRVSNCRGLAGSAVNCRPNLALGEYSDLRWTGDALSRQLGNVVGTLGDSAREIACHLALADAEPTESPPAAHGGPRLPRRRSRARGSDLKSIRGTDVIARSGGVVLEVTVGRTPRSVPFLSFDDARLVEAAQARNLSRRSPTGCGVSY